ncbi:MAG TPA: hypothetical protein VF287_08280 [Usitatibacter sp.]
MIFQARISLLAAAALAMAAHAATPFVAATPSIPVYGQSVTLEIRNFDFPFYLPATRYSIQGNVIDIDYEYVTDGWSISAPDVGAAPVNLGELPPGNYTVNARLYDIANPGTDPQLITTNVPVLAPTAWGIYPVPRNPDAYATTWATVRSAVYYDAATMRATVAGNVIRVDFEYYGNAPTSGAAPAGATSYGAVKIAGLAPGHYRLEGWGRPKTGGDSARYFTSDIAVGSTSPVVEYYAPSIDHYFISAGPSDIALLDPGTLGWKRSGQGFKAWFHQSDAPPGAVPVCRFYASGPNSHFYTGSASDCEWLKGLEAQGHAQAAANNTTFTGWQFEQIAFYSLMPINGQCPGDTVPVYRAYNQRAALNDSNHRFMSDLIMRYAQLATGWGDEGVQFCSPL